MAKGYTYGVDISVLPHRGDCIRPVRENNPLYPLPPRFLDLKNPKEQSWWRVNACCIQETPADFVDAYNFLFFTYLWPPEALFLQDRRAPAKFHYQMVHDLAAYHFNAFGAPRHGCKTVLLRIVYILLLLTRRNYRCGYLTSKQKKYRECLNEVRKQLANNPLILNDFGRVQPIRGGVPWNSDEMELAYPFGNRLTGMSLDSRERGWHGEFLGVDDPERDPSSDEVIPEYVRILDTRLRHVYMPMVEIATEDLARKDISQIGRGIAYFGTILGENMVLNRILTAEPGSPYDSWNRWKFEQESKGHYLWPERWAAHSSAIQRKVLGEDAFDAEKQGRPGQSQTGLWQISPLYHSYHLDSDDGFLRDPHKSKAVIRWAMQSDSGPSWRAVEAREFVAALNIGIIIDTHKIKSAIEVKTLTDFTVIHVLGNDATGTIWSLDIRRDRFNWDEAVEALFDLCFIWKPTFIAIEACGLYSRIADELQYKIQSKLFDEVGWAPVPREIPPFNDRTEGKGVRIERIGSRFRLHKIRFPWWRRGFNPYDQCFHEVQNFTRDLSKLKYDDVVDTLGLIPYVFKGAGGRRIESNPWTGKTIEQLLEDGKMVTKQGTHIVDMLPSLSDLSPLALAKLEQYYEGKNSGCQKTPIRFVKACNLRRV